LAGRDIEAELVPLLTEEKVGLLVWSPLAGGFLSGKFDRTGSSDSDARHGKTGFPPVDVESGYDIVDVLRKVAERREATVPQTALAWVLAQPGVTSVIAGAKRLDQLTGNLAAVDLELTAEDLAELDEVSRPVARYPGWLQADQSWRHPAA
jgi:aryl-alcohol dehydrogenase-like predicted oxidoreductase